MWRLLSVVVACSALIGTGVYSLATPQGGAPAAAPAPLLASVKGTVTLDGEPLPAGMVHVVADDGRMYVAAIHQGKFFLPHAPTGKVHVAVIAPPVLPAAPSPSGPRLLRLPVKYHDHHTSGLTGQLKQGEQHVSLELRSE